MYQITNHCTERGISSNQNQPTCCTIQNPHSTSPPPRKEVNTEMQFDISTIGNAARCEQLISSLSYHSIYYLCLSLEHKILQEQGINPPNEISDASSQVPTTENSGVQLKSRTLAINYHRKNHYFSQLLTYYQRLRPELMNETLNNLNYSGAGQ